MPWVEIGLHQFDLKKIVHVKRGVEFPDADAGVTISFENGEDVDLKGDDCEVFLAIFAKYTAQRRFGKPPPGPSVVTGECLMDDSFPGKIGGIEHPRLVN